MLEELGDPRRARPDLGDRDVVTPDVAQLVDDRRIAQRRVDVPGRDVEALGDKGRRGG
jgi:hypothetical protein